MANYNYREVLGMPTLSQLLGVSKLKTDLNARQYKAHRNIAYCAENQWQYVNSWIDEKSEECRQFVMNPRELFETIYSESLRNVYDEGMECFNDQAKSYLKDIRFCGKHFLQTAVFYHMTKFLESAVPEVGGTEEDSERVLKELKAMKEELKI